ncbi:hypothetical protein L9G16_10165 [Shewanella sp. A25]|nr:hypothetical protein [Shewanella shenzhenensis]
MTVEIKIQKLIRELNKSGRNIPTEIWDFQDDLGYQLFDEFLDDVSSKKIRILRHSRNMDASLFSLVASKQEKLIGFAGQLLFWVALPLAIVLGVIYSWWFLLLTPALYFTDSKLIVSSYNSAIFNVAKNYESGFCLLYYIGQIAVGNTDSYKIAFYEGD